MTSPLDNDYPRKRKKNPVDVLITGIIAGFLVPLVGLPIIWLGKYDWMSFGEYLQFLYNQGMETMPVALGAILNLGLFYLFFNLKWNNAARGVLIATLIHIGLAALFLFII